MYSCIGSNFGQSNPNNRTHTHKRRWTVRGDMVPDTCYTAENSRARRPKIILSSSRIDAWAELTFCCKWMEWLPLQKRWASNQPFPFPYVSLVAFFFNFRLWIKAWRKKKRQSKLNQNIKQFPSAYTTDSVTRSTALGLWIAGHWKMKNNLMVFGHPRGMETIITNFIAESENRESI